MRLQFHLQRIHDNDIATPRPRGVAACRASVRPARRAIQPQAIHLPSYWYG